MKGTKGIIDRGIGYGYGVGSRLGGPSVVLIFAADRHAGGVGVRRRCAYPVRDSCDGVCSTV